jgi:hypothetical protein
MKTKSKNYLPEKTLLTAIYKQTCGIAMPVLGLQATPFST